MFPFSESPLDVFQGLLRFPNFPRDALTNKVDCFRSRRENPRKSDVPTFLLIFDVGFSFLAPALGDTVGVTVNNKNCVRLHFVLPQGFGLYVVGVG